MLGGGVVQEFWGSLVRWGCIAFGGLYVEGRRGCWFCFVLFFRIFLQSRIDFFSLL